MTEPKQSTHKHTPVCDYEGSDYQSRFWDAGGRKYEDECEAIALKRLLPTKGELLLELGAGAGRNTLRYTGFDRIVLVDYSSTQLVQARDRLGPSDRFIYVVADIYQLPFIKGLFDGATMIRTIHHMVDAPAALHQVHRVLRSKATFILEYANKRNLKSILRFLLAKQNWNPFSKNQIEFAPLNFNFHPAAIDAWLHSEGFHIERKLTVSHLRIGIFKRMIPAKVLAWIDGILQWTGDIWQLTPSVFVRATSSKGESRPTPSNPVEFFQCPKCGYHPLQQKDNLLVCNGCQRRWTIKDGIYILREEET